MITDPSIRAILRIALEEGKRLKVVNDNLHAAFKTLQVGSTLPTPVLRAPLKEDAVAVPEAGPILSSRLRSALEKGLDVTRLAQQGLHINKDGSIANIHGDKLFPPAFAFAVRAILNVQKVEEPTSIT